MSAALRLAALALPLLALAGCTEMPAAEAPAPAPRAAAAQPPPPAVPPGMLRPAHLAAASAPQRILPTLPTPLGLAAAPTSIGIGGAEPAPIPDRNVEAPADPFADVHAARLEPMMLPPERRQGATFGSEHLRDTGPDRPFDTLMPGARLRIPFD